MSYTKGYLTSKGGVRRSSIWGGWTESDIDPTASATVEGAVPGLHCMKG